ncbi:MAG: EAL domain-containing protein [Clostridiales Family XIII bacterium]|jgi:lactose/cellobiose-specific phosphotransferase system IIC component|nr:EAL domain-containing protein [Clostridiales Family XIII bacterium]
MLTIFDRISDNSLLRAIRRGLILIIPIVMAGSFALVINNFPVRAYQDFMLLAFGDTWKNLGGYIWQGTFAILSMAVLMSISYSMTEAYVHRTNVDLHPFFGSVTALACYIAVMYIPESEIPLRFLGALGLFIAIVIAVVSSQIFILLHAFGKFRMRIYSDSADRTVGQSLHALFPAFITICVFSAIHLLFDSAGIADMQSLMYERFRMLFGDTAGANLGTALSFVLLSHLFWIFGLHGTNIMEPVVNNVFVPNLELNAEQLAQGLEPTHMYSKEFFDIFVFPGGSGASLCLILAIVFLTKRTNTRQIAIISSIPSIFNINEILIYGVPIVLNPFFAIPFILTPAVLTLTTTAAMSAGLVPLVTTSANWTTPVLLSGFMATGSVSGSLLQIFNIFVGAACYGPFVILFQKHKAQEGRNALKGLTECVLAGMQNLTARGDSIGNLARGLAIALKDDLQTALAEDADRPDCPLFLEYQPQIKSDGNLHGVEALLRWKHPQLGMIPPPVTVALAEDSEIEDLLCRWTLRRSFRELKNWNKRGLATILSVNLSPTQISDDIAELVARELESNSIDPNMIELEVTEQLALTTASRRRLAQLKELGVRLAMDDFGMGHTSLLYLKEFDLSTLKLDGVLVKDILDSATSRDIIKSISHLAEASDIELIAEYVETREQSDMLRSLGVHIYQGYLYSKPLLPDRLFIYWEGLRSSLLLQGRETEA